MQMRCSLSMIEKVHSVVEYDHLIMKITQGRIEKRKKLIREIYG